MEFLEAGQSDYDDDEIEPDSMRKVASGNDENAEERKENLNNEMGTDTMMIDSTCTTYG